MMEFENPDPRGEYKRTCPYCDEEFTAQHMNREYCPEKNGIIDYCKNRYKRLAKLEKEEQARMELEEATDTLQKPMKLTTPNRFKLTT